MGGLHDVLVLFVLIVLSWFALYVAQSLEEKYSFALYPAVPVFILT